jgi:hypothetical protein
MKSHDFEQGLVGQQGSGLGANKTAYDSTTLLQHLLRVGRSKATPNMQSTALHRAF